MSFKTSVKESTSSDVEEKGADRDRAERSLKDIHAHNRESLDALLAHVEEQCRARREEISTKANAEAGRVVQTARDRAAELLHEVRERERRNLDEQLRVERARQLSRIRQRELSERLAMAERGLALVREQLVKVWNSGNRARMNWLERALTDAATVLAADHWQLRHPEGWSADEAATALVERVAPKVEIDWKPVQDLTEGFVISAGKAWVDATPAGLTARGERIAGVLLAQLPESNSSLPDSSAQDSPAPDKEVRS